MTIEVAGRLILPKAMRERLHLRAGSRLTAQVVADKIELTPASDAKLKLVRKGKRLVLPKAGIAFDAAAAVREEHEAQATRGRPR